MTEYEIPYEGIVYFPGFIKNIDHVNQLIEELNASAVTPWTTWFANGDTHVYGDLKSFSKQWLDKEVDEDVKSKCKDLMDILTQSMVDCAIEYAKIYNIEQDRLDFAIQALESEKTIFGINKYNEKSFMGPHTDWNEVNNGLEYTIVVYLNENYEGGELYFLNQDIKIKSKAGSLVFFPSRPPFLHQSLEVIKGRKMLITHHWKAIEPDKAIDSSN